MLSWNIKGINNNNRNHKGHWEHNMWIQAEEVIKGQMDGEQQAVSGESPSTLRLSKLRRNWSQLKYEGQIPCKPGITFNCSVTDR